MKISRRRRVLGSPVAGILTPLATVDPRVFGTRQLPDDAALAWITAALMADSATLEAEVIEV